MTIIVEDGTGKSDAESYVSVSDFRTYQANRGVDVTLWTDAQVEQSLRKAVDYLQAQYRGQWLGYKTVSTQALDFPRIGIVVDDFITIESNAIPNEIKTAQYELAYKAKTETLLTDEEQRVKREKVGEIEVEYTDFGAVQKQFKQVNGILKPFLQNNGSTFTAKVVRV